MSTGARVVGTVVVTTGLLVPAQAASASCSTEAGPQGSPVIFAGTAEAARGGYTRFEVDEVRAGPDLARHVWVLSGQTQAGVSSSVDMDFVDGQRYLVGASRSFATDACSVSDVVGTPPAGTRSPVADGSTGTRAPGSPAGRALRIAGGSVALLSLAAWLVRRVTRRRPPRSSVAGL